MIRLTVAIDRYPHTDPLRRREVVSQSVSLEFIEFDNIIKAFRPMVMSQEFDLSEVALVTFFQAFEVGQPLLLLPVVTTGGIHHDRLRVLPGNGHNPFSPGGLKGRRVGVRSYSQTTGLWVRGILTEEFGLGYGDIEWVTTEPPHVGSYQEPPFVHRAPANTSLRGLLQLGDVDAVVTQPGSDTRALIPDTAARQRAWYVRHGTTGINHMITVRRDLVEQQPEAVAEVYRMLSEAHRMAEPSDGTVVGTLPPDLPSSVRFGVDNVRVAVELAGRYACEQGLISHSPRIDLIFPSFLLD